MPIVDHRAQCEEVARTLLEHKDQCHYSESANRWGWHAYRVPTFPFFGDCSSTFAAIDYWAGCDDPNGVNYAYGDTTTLLEHAQTKKLLIPKSKLLKADGCLFSVNGVTVHVAMALQDGTVGNPLFFNMGSSADPSVQPLSVLLTIGTPTFFRNVTDTRVPHRRP